MKFTSDQKIWFTADTHYWHNNMTYGVSVWPSKETSTRRFDTVQEMSRHIVSQINKYVGQDDILFHLGDWSFGGINNIWNFRKQIICKNIHFMIGNHDQHIKKSVILPNCHVSENGDIEDGEIRKGSSFSAYAKYLFSSVQDYLEIEIDKHQICMMHYPIDSWNRGFVHLHGHTHSKHPIKDMRLDVGIDNAFKLYGEYRPFDWNDIKKQLKI